jgi:hypothetical protein
VICQRLDDVFYMRTAGSNTFVSVRDFDGFELPEPPGVQVKRFLFEDTDHNDWAFAKRMWLSSSNFSVPFRDLCDGTVGAFCDGVLLLAGSSGLATSNGIANVYYSYLLLPAGCFSLASTGNIVDVFYGCFAASCRRAFLA